MSKSLYAANEAVAFLLELLVLVVLGLWGFETGPNTAVSILLGLGTPALAAVVWGLFAAPRARFPLPLAGTLAVKAVVFAAAVAALAALGQPVLAAVLAVVLAANTAVAVRFRSKLQG
ncbi:MAG TPA: YrdB family protein [Streptosporangiaceae bacterium]